MDLDGNVARGAEEVRVALGRVEVHVSPGGSPFVSLVESFVFIGLVDDQECPSRVQYTFYQHRRKSRIARLQFRSDQDSDVWRKMHP